MHPFTFLKKPTAFYIMIFVVMISGCTDVPSEPEAPSENTISIAAFNIQVFGKTKAGKPEVMKILSKTIRNFDIVAIQEIRDISETALPKLLEQVNSNNISNYAFIVSARLGRTSSKEQYAYLYNTQTLEQIETPYVYPEPTGDPFHREPYIARFRILDNNRTFVLITVHTDPNEATQEIEALPSVVENAQAVFAEEEYFIVLGDLNADCRYFDEDKQSLLRSSDYFWAIDNSADTTTKSTDCTYDRIIFTGAVEHYFTGDSGVFRFDTEYGLTYDETVAVSDHYPVYAVFYNKIPEHSSIWKRLFG